MAYLKCWPEQNEGFAFISVRYTINFRESIYEIEIQTQPWNVNMYMETVISNLHIWNVDTTKMGVMSLFQIATRLNTQNQENETEIQTELWYEFFLMEKGIGFI